MNKKIKRLWNLRITLWFTYLACLMVIEMIMVKLPINDPYIFILVFGILCEVALLVIYYVDTKNVKELMRLDFPERKWRGK